MSYRKRFLATVLAVLMAVSTLTTIGFSANTSFADVSVAEGRDLHDAISVLSDLEIAKGRVTADGETIFAGDEAVTREQFALFTARIVTGTPQFFAEQDQEALKTLQGLFSDMGNADVTYAGAIAYCVENGIINGYPDGTFNPKGTIELREAIKMLVTALGYTGLAYPQGYLSKASEQTVALIGNFVTTPDFHFAGRASTDKITRNDMAKLLYNFLLSSYYKVELAWNGVTGRYESQVNTSPTIEKFGITPVVGYIVGVENYAMRLDVRDYNDLKSGTVSVDSVNRNIGQYDLRPATFQGTAITARQIADLRRGDLAGFDAQILYRDWVNTAPSNATPVYAWSAPREIRTTLAELGLDDTIDPRQHLGKKVIAYRRINTLAARTTTLPAAVVVGAKDLGVNSNNKATLDTMQTFTLPNTVPESRVRTDGNNTGVFDLTLDQGSLGAPQFFNQRVQSSGADAKELNLRFNLYAYTQNGNLVSDNGSKWEARGIYVTVATGTSLVVDTNDLVAVESLRTSGGDATADRNANKQRLTEGSRNNATTNGLTQYARRTTRLALYENSIEKELAKMVANNGHYELWYVDNGYDRFGNKEFFYEFIPYRVGYYVPATSSDDRIKMVNAQGNNQNAQGNNQSESPGFTFDDQPQWGANDSGSDNTRRSQTGVKVKPLGSTTNTRGEAYLYTFFGAYHKDLYLHEQLPRITSTTQGAEVQYTTSGTVGFSNLSARPQATFNVNTGARALGGIYANHVSNFRPRAQYALWADPNDSTTILLMRETQEPPAAQKRTPEYAVALSTNEDPGRAGVSRPVGYPDGSVGYIFDLYNASQPNRRNFVLKGGDSTDNILAIAPGEYLALFENTDGSYEVNVLTANSRTASMVVSPPSTITGIGNAIITGGSNNPNNVSALRTYFGTSGFYSAIAQDTTHSGRVGIPGNAAISYETTIRRLTLRDVFDELIATSTDVTTWAGRTNSVATAPTNFKGGIMAYADNSTKFIVFGAKDITLNASGNPTSVVTSVASWTAALYTANNLDNRFLTNSYRAAIVAKTNNIAEVVFISTVEDVTQSLIAEQYGVIVDNDIYNPFNNQGQFYMNGTLYDTRTAYVYSDSTGTKFEQVCAPAINSALDIGNVVAISAGTTVTAPNGQVYKLATRVDNSLGTTTPWGTTGDNVIRSILGLSGSSPINSGVTNLQGITTYFGKVTQYSEGSHFTLSQYNLTTPTNAPQIVVTMPNHNRSRSIFVTGGNVTGSGDIVSAATPSQVQAFVGRFVGVGTGAVGATDADALTRLTQERYNWHNGKGASGRDDEPSNSGIYAVVDMIGVDVINVTYIIVNASFNDNGDNGRFANSLRVKQWRDNVQLP